MTKISPAITQALGRHSLTLKKYSPQIMFGVGVAGTVVSTVLACRATLQLDDALVELDGEIAGIKADHLPGECNKDLAYVYGKHSIKMVRLYAPAIAVGATSIGLLTGSHVTMNRRNAGLTAAYAATAKAYDDYRERVQKLLGEEDERNIYHAASIHEIENAEGKKEKVVLSDPNKVSPYAKFFDDYNVNWVKNPELNRLFVQAQQNYANHLLQARGHVLLNEVYDMLGIDRSQMGTVVGWVMGGEGDNYIDFGMFEAGNENFINGFERNILLDFNVDGVIYDLIGK